MRNAVVCIICVLHISVGFFFSQQLLQDCIVSELSFLLSYINYYTAEKSSLKKVQSKRQVKIIHTFSLQF